MNTLHRFATRSITRYRPDARFAVVSKTSMLKSGDRAPKIELADQHGAPFTLKGVGKRKVLVYFYPRADTPGCTQQSCLLRDLIVNGKIRRTAIVGISPDTLAKQLKFDNKYLLGFPLLADTDNVVAKAYKVWRKKSINGTHGFFFENTRFVSSSNG